jgi:beta-phosphoglucomutase
MKTKNHIIFDFNGVIVDDEGLHFQSAQKVLKLISNLDITLKEYYDFFAGRANYLGFSSYLGFKNKKDDIDNLIFKKNEIYMEFISKEIPVVDSTIRFIKDNYSKYYFSIVTGAQRKEVEFILNKLNLLQMFEMVLCSDDITESKPSPQGYLKAISLSKISVENSVVIEDSISGITAAKRAHARCIALTTTYKREEIAHADLIVDELCLEDIEKFFN